MARAYRMRDFGSCQADLVQIPLPPNGTWVFENRYTLLSDEFVTTDARAEYRLDPRLSIGAGGGMAWHQGVDFPYGLVSAEVLLRQVRIALRTARYIPRTEAAYLVWIRRFVRFHGLRHPDSMGEAVVTTFLTHLATEWRVASSTQTQALSALLYLCREVLRRPLADLGRVVRARACSRRAPKRVGRRWISYGPGSAAASAGARC